MSQPARHAHLRPVPLPTREDAVARLVGEPEHGFIPRGFRREAAAYYIGVSPSKFDEMVTDRRMPGPKKDGKTVIWDRRALDAAFDALPDRDAEAANPYRD